MYCNKCMNEIPNGTYCKKCVSENNINNAPHHLRLGTTLNRKYVVGAAIGEGGFGITYVGRDTLLDRKVAIKEYYPNGYASRSHEHSNTLSITTEKQKDFFQKGKERFLLEARSLAKFDQEKGIVDVRDYFEENGTAYIIMEFLDGVTLSNYIKQRGLFRAETIFTLMKPVMNSLHKIHNNGIIHRDISPDNIMLLKDGTMKLMDFGAARYFLDQNNMMSVVLKRGYAPEEQYRQKGHQGPWTDVYGMCATIYYCITGKTPADALDRLHVDDIRPPSQLGVSISRPLETVLMYGLAVHKENRFQSMSDLKVNVDMAMDMSQPNKTPRLIQENIYRAQPPRNPHPQTPPPVYKEVVNEARRESPKVSHNEPPRVSHNEPPKKNYNNNPYPTPYNAPQKKDREEFEYIPMERKKDLSDYLFNEKKKNIILILAICLAVIFLITILVSFALTNSSSSGNSYARPFIMSHISSQIQHIP